MNSSNQLPPPRKSKGRQKVNMVKMENQSNLQVTFSKRRAGLFKKASELCTLCGAEAAIVVFSPAEKVYCFGHPNVKTVVDRMSDGMPPATPINPRSQLIIDAHRNSTIRELNLELTQVESLMRTEKRRAEELEVVRKAGEMQHWIPTSFDYFNYAQLCVLKESIMGFKKNLDAKVQREMLTLSNPLPFHHPAEKTETPGGFSLGVSADHTNYCVPAFDVPQLSLRPGDVSSYSNADIGFSNNFASNYSSAGQASNVDPMTNNSNYLRASGLSEAMFFVGGTNNSSYSKLPTTNDSKAVGSTRDFGFNIGHDHGLF